MHKSTLGTPQRGATEESVRKRAVVSQPWIGDKILKKEISDAHLADTKVTRKEKNGPACRRNGSRQRTSWA